MAMRTTHRVQCGCGHMGAIRQVENDQPYSSPYDAYSPVDLTGARVEFTRPVDWPEILELMALACPACGAALNQGHIIKQT